MWILRTLGVIDDLGRDGHARRRVLASLVTLSPSTTSRAGKLHGLARLTRQAVHLDDVADGDLGLPAAGTDDRVHRGSPR